MNFAIDHGQSTLRTLEIKSGIVSFVSSQEAVSHVGAKRPFIRKRDIVVDNE
jgi:hypothetical protein